MGYQLKNTYTQYILHYNCNLFAHKVNTYGSSHSTIYTVLFGILRDVCQTFVHEMLIWIYSQINWGKKVMSWLLNHSVDCFVGPCFLADLHLVIFTHHFLTTLTASIQSSNNNFHHSLWLWFFGYSIYRSMLPKLSVLV